MTLSWLAIAWLHALPLAAGIALLRAIGVRGRDDRVAFLGWAWLCGSMLLAVALLGWSWFDLPKPLWGATGILVLGGIGAELRARRRGAAAPASPAAVRAPSFAQRLEQGLFLLVLAFTLAITVNRVVVASTLICSGGDESAIWAAKAKVFFFAGGMDARFVELLTLHGVAHPDYPSLNPLLQWWTYLHAGDVVDVENRFPIFAFVFAMQLVAAGALRRLVRPLFAAALLLLLTVNQSMQLTSWMANADGIVAFGLLVATDAWLRFSATGERRWWALVSLGLGAGLFAKNEGALVAVTFAAGLAVLAVASKPARARLASLGSAHLWLLVPIGLEAVHRACNARFDVTNDLFGAGGDPPIWKNIDARLDPGSFAMLARWFGKVWFVPTSLVPRLPDPDSPWLQTSDQNFLFGAFLFSSLADPRRALRSPLGVVTIALLLAVAGFAVVYLGTVHELEWHLRTSVGRVLFDLLPAATVVLAALHSPHERAHPGDGGQGREAGGVPQLAHG